jgi:hypothetical protein
MGAARRAKDGRELAQLDKEFEAIQAKPTTGLLDSIYGDQLW